MPRSVIEVLVLEEARGAAIINRIRYVIAILIVGPAMSMAIMAASLPVALVAVAIGKVVSHLAILDAILPLALVTVAIGKVVDPFANSVVILPLSLVAVAIAKVVGPCSIGTYPNWHTAELGCVDRGRS